MSWIRRASAVLLAATTFAVLPSPGHAGKVKAVPYALSVRIASGEQPGPRDWLDALHHELLVELTAERCFLSVGSDDSEAQVELSLYVDEYEEETVYAISQHELDDPDATPDVASRRVVELEVRLLLELRAGTGDPLKSKDSQLQVNHRPLVYYGDPRLAARGELVDAAVRAASRFACKGSRRKLAASIERALAGTSRGD